MHLYTVDRAAGQRIDRFGSDFVLCHLTSLDGRAQVTCFHLAPGELVGEHDAAVDQLFCVVGGEGWVSGSDGLPHEIRANQVAHWSAGEAHAAGTESGLTAIVLESREFTVAADPLEGSS